MMNQGIIAYGNKTDREKLKAIAKAEGKTGSSWLIAQIRQRHKELFGHD